MLVYCNSLSLTGPDDREKALVIMAKWLSQHAGVFVAPEKLSSRYSQKRTQKGHYQIISATESYPLMYSIQFSHPDSKVSGRQWIIEIGLRQETPEQNTDRTVLSRTSEISARVQGTIEATRPKFIKEISETCSLSQEIPGQKTRTLNEDSASAFLYEVEREERVAPIVIVSPLVTGGYLVDVEYLRSLLIGLADVVKIPEDANTYGIANATGSRYSAWAGAINIVLNRRKGAVGQYPANSCILADEIEELRLSGRGRKIENEVLSRVAHRTNLPYPIRTI